MVIKIPAFLQLRRQYGLLITDGEVSVVSWYKGEMERLGLFSNDDAGVARFLEFLSQNERTFRERGFYVMVNVIGEDYRFEKVPHLIGKYRTDFHTKRMQQLFRGSQFCMSQVQGREERGRREDWVLFSGVLTEGKVAPWINAVVRGGRYLTGVHIASQLLSDVVFGAAGGSKKGNTLLMTIHERGVLRQTFYSNGYLRFSRVSKINHESAELAGSSIKKELERTLQYLGSLKISVSGGLTVRVITPSQLVGQLREVVASGERIKFVFEDVAQVAQKIGLKTPVEALGRDSSLPLHAMFSTLRINQLAKVNLITYHWTSLVVKTVLIASILYGINAYSTPVQYLYDGYFGYTTEVAARQEEAEKLERQYNAEVSSVAGEPPSSPENMKAVSDLYNVLEGIRVSPTQLLYYIGQGLRRNPGVQLTGLDWRVSNAPEGEGDENKAIINGEDLYQIAQVRGMFQPRGGRETYRDVADRSDRLIASFQGRQDIYVEVIEAPAREFSTANLSGDLSSEEDVEAPRSREFELRIIWKAYDSDNFASLVDES